MKRILFIFLLLITYGNSFAANDLRIYQIFGDGGNSSAKYNQDYIILYNNGSSNVNLTGWSLQFNTASSTTTNWFKLDLGSTIQAKGFLLIAIAVNNTTGVGAIGDPLITPDITWSYFRTGGLSPNDGKLALMNNQVVLNTQTPVGNSALIDFVGYGTANASEGTAAVGPTAAHAIVRINDGQDTDNNSNDFNRTTTFTVEGHRLTNSSSFPVHLTSFTSQNTPTSISILWSTASETNFSHFIVQKSKDAKGFENIGRIESAGFDSEKSEYSFIDEKPFAGNNYYRLKMVDKDGTEDYSKMINVNFDGKALAVFYPNPTQDFVRFENIKTEDISSVVVHKINGEYLGETHTTTDGIDISGFKSRELILQLKMKNNQTITSRIIKNL